jgi:SAM-dependent methyltransferase
MTREQSIIELGSWLKSPPGEVLRAWEQRRMDEAVADVFGYHAVQLGLPAIDALRDNRMPHRWVASDTWQAPAERADTGAALHCEFDALPFPANSIDLMVLPHTLELARDPHHTLREVERVLVPEGRVVITGFNPVSLWGLRQRLGHARRGVGLGRREPLFLPASGEFLGYWRLRDWLRLLSFEVEAGQFGCWSPPLKSEPWLQRWQWMERVGDRWWPVLGAVYQVVAVKRVRGMRLVGLMKQARRKPAAAPAVVANRHFPRQQPARARSDAAHENP